MGRMGRMAGGYIHAEPTLDVNVLCCLQKRVSVVNVTSLIVRRLTCSDGIGVWVSAAGDNLELSDAAKTMGQVRIRSREGATDLICEEGPGPVGITACFDGTHQERVRSLMTLKLIPTSEGRTDIRTSQNRSGTVGYHRLPLATTGHLTDVRTDNKVGLNDDRNMQLVRSVTAYKGMEHAEAHTLTQFEHTQFGTTVCAAQLAIEEGAWVLCMLCKRSVLREAQNRINNTLARSLIPPEFTYSDSRRDRAEGSPFCAEITVRTSEGDDASVKFGLPERW
ncbi:hypothetical protein EDD17DRAFT_1512497 [Pisolithus thermaeus]|nr:hypothetical protein EDD17DRAFT_1512497 [Pisolithus thermaeus]